VYFCSIQKSRRAGKNPENQGITLLALYLYWRAATRRPGFAEEYTPGRTLQRGTPVKKLFALMVVASLAAIGCDDKKTSPPKGGGTVTDTKTQTVVRTGVDTRTVVEATRTDVITNTKIVTTTVPEKPKKDGPSVPDPKKGDGK
jgi:hypothetical protein